ncbi:MAG: ChaN family lipoprotein [Planctomycetota bacterium]|nr:ChaN family lipoprotein [Planctomycetota bacterium]MDA0932675.1 ChaN family lipoprotein [Planctomycetota bacterium]MDA1221645.1 ChaN family lipoprotein [Planctomycetota bacterium]
MTHCRSTKLLCVLPLLASACTMGPPPLELGAVADDVAASDVVFVGEEHDNDVGHLQHYQLLRMVHARRPDLVLSMEMFERDVQDVLDRYLRGEIDEAAFLADSRPWGNYRTHYRPMVEYAKRHGLPVIAANCPTPLARQVAKEGVAAAAGNPNAAAETSSPKDAYWDAFQAAMSGHGGVDEKTIYSFYQAQCLKDDTMAESILAAREGRDPAPLVFHVQGKFHGDEGLGAAARVSWRAPDLRCIVLTMSSAPNAVQTAPGRYRLDVPTQPKIEEVEAPGDHEEQVEEAVEIPAAGGRPALGFMPNYEDGVLGVLVEMVVEGGPAEAGGVRAGDVIIGIDDRDVDSVSDYMEALANLTVGQRVKVRVQRGDEQKSFDVKVGQRSQ